MNNTSDSYVVHLTLNEWFTGIRNLWQEMIHHCKPLFSQLQLTYTEGCFNVLEYG